MRKILVVEDEPELRDTYELILSTEPYEVRVASNGKQALEICQEKSYQLILLDLMMPIMDGVQFLENFKVEEHPNTKIIIISNLSMGEMLSKAMELGAQRSVVKADLTPKELLSLVRYEVTTV
ncbi:MAG: PleD family two-component system response regulator [Candidatus Saccharimonadales bacterium]|jgi:CheY-like chemotaxis protein